LLSFLKYADVVSGRLDNVEKEPIAETIRKHQLELQRECVMRQLQILKVEAEKEQKKLEKKYRQATEKLDAYQDRHRTGRKDALQNVEKAKQERLELKQHREKEQAVITEYRAACERLLHEELANNNSSNLSDGRDRAMTSQKSSYDEIEKLALASQSDVATWKTLMVQAKTHYQHQMLEVLDNEVGKALNRANTVRGELDKSKQRITTWEHDLHQSKERISLLSDERQQSTKRQKLAQYLIKDRLLKVKKAKRTVNDAKLAVEKELVLAVEQEKTLQQDLGMLSEKKGKIQREISLVDQRQRWFDEMNSAPADDSVARQISVESDRRKEQLQRLLQGEEELFQTLQETRKNRKLSKRALETASETLTTLEGKIDGMWEEHKQVDQTYDQSEKNLQTQLQDACKREQRTEKQVNLALSKEQKLLQKLRVVSGNEKMFEIPLQSGEFSCVVI